MRIERFALPDGGDPVALAREVRALAPAGASVADAVRDIVAAVREGGDAALDDFTRRYDLGGGDPPPVRVPTHEIDAAGAALRSDVRAGLEVAMANVAAVAGASLGDDSEILLPQGQRVLVREIPVRRAAVYVPGGRAPYPSTVVMGTVTARVAGVEQVVLCTPPPADPVILGAAAICGVDEVLQIGGAHGVAALAYGTASVAPVDVIVGPGSLWVQEAKLQCSAQVGIEGFMGPSDLLLVAAEGCDPRLAAFDLLGQAEHGEGSLVVLVTDDAALAEEIVAVARALAADRPQVSFAPLAVVGASHMDEAIAFANAFAPEHLQLAGERAEHRAPAIRCAGTLLVGTSSGTAFTDYVAGSNHVLPTGGAARFASGLNPRHFRRRMSQVHLDGSAAALARVGAPIARAEGFTVHAESMEARKNGAQG